MERALSNTVQIKRIPGAIDNLNAARDALMEKSSEKALFGTSLISG